MSSSSPEDLYGLHPEEIPPLGSPEFDEWAAQDMRQSILITMWLMLALTVIFVAMRFYVRVRVFSRLLVDDYYLIAALLCGALSATLATIAVDSGNGLHMAILSDRQQQDVVMWTTAAFCPGIMFFGLPKVAIVLLLVRLLDPPKGFRIFLWSLIAISQVSFICLIGLLLGRCNPPARMWNPAVDGDCMDIHIVTDFAMFTGAFSAFIDVVLAVYPAFVLLQTKMPLRRKVGLTVVLGVGAVGGGVAIYKTLIIPYGLGSTDFSYHSARIIIWTTVEGSTHIMAASMPVFAPLMDMVLNGGNPFRRSKRAEKPYKHFRTNSHAMNSISFDKGAVNEAGGSNNFSESQDDILPVGKDVKVGSDGVGKMKTRSMTPMPGPGEILCTNEIDITYERKRPMEPLEAMVRGYGSASWKDW
ncbi:hypothetical protein B0I35DRAFT_513461 [Stachybotrys elegans]|uniref:Rhodopsin domain-containing protein n=1 Tax=Stachybotrys elegans TaxID=80388 RepID=A0A8K0WQM0_9HYPO|nr:hypothetical protein B0I35DRAFT_513461 [Stachybotrys elegans]